MPSSFMNQVTWQDFQHWRTQAEPVVLLPVGALEQHGPHLPLGTDAILAEAVAADAAASLGALVAPTLQYGYKSQPKCGGGQHFPGTTSLDGATLSAVTCDLLSELVRHGVRRIAIVSGHYENQWFLTEGIDLALRRIGASTPVRVMRLEYWDFLTETLLDEIFPDGFPGFALEHAALIETSLMLHYRPDLVRIDRIPEDAAASFPPYDLYPPHPHWVPASGVLSSAKGATAGKGCAMARMLATRIAAAIDTEFRHAG